MVTETCHVAMRTPEVLNAISQYVAAVLVDGDYLNDFLTHIPECGAGTVQAVGMILAALLGFPS